MTEVVSSINRVSQIMGAISPASIEQSSDVSQAGAAMNPMDQLTQQNAALVEQGAAAAECLRRLPNSWCRRWPCSRWAGAAMAPSQRGKRVDARTGLQFDEVRRGFLACQATGGLLFEQARPWADLHHQPPHADPARAHQRPEAPVAVAARPAGRPSTRSTS